MVLYSFFFIVLSGLFKCHTTTCMILLWNSEVSYKCMSWALVPFSTYFLQTKVISQSNLNSQLPLLPRRSQALHLELDQVKKATHLKPWSLPHLPRISQKLCSKGWRSIRVLQTRQKRKATPARHGEWGELSRSGTVVFLLSLCLKEASM